MVLFILIEYGIAIEDNELRSVRTYADASVYGGVYDEEFADVSVKFFDQVRTGRFLLVVSSLVRDELTTAPTEVKADFDRWLTYADIVDITEEAINLRRNYIDAGIVTKRSLADALHVAIATVMDCSLIVSWNFPTYRAFRKDTAI